MISVELLLDPALESAIRADWRALADADLSSAGRHTGEGNRPHVTLAVRDRPRSLELPASAVPMPVELGGLVLFRGSGDRCVLARHVVVTAELSALHAAVAGIVGPADDPRYANTEPDRWTPHVTLAKRMPVGRLPDALALVSSDPLAGSFTGLRIWDSATATITDIAAGA